MRESLTRSVAALKAELAGPAAPPLERLLAERVACCWMQAGHADAALAGSRARARPSPSWTCCSAGRSGPSGRYLAAIKALATVRRLAVAASPAAPTEAARAEEARPRRSRRDRGRVEGVAASAMRPATDGGGTARGDRKKAGKGRVRQEGVGGAEGPARPDEGAGGDRELGRPRRGTSCPG